MCLVLLEHVLCATACSLASLLQFPIVGLSSPLVEIRRQLCLQSVRYLENWKVPWDVCRSSEASDLAKGLIAAVAPYTNDIGVVTSVPASLTIEISNTSSLLGWRTVS
jgi:hypothetical protein